MQYFDAIRVLPTATHIYADVTDKEVAKLTGTFYVTQIDGVTVVGTQEVIKSLDSKELVPGKMNFN